MAYPTIFQFSFDFITPTNGMTCNPSDPTLCVEILDILERKDADSTSKPKGNPT